jgi:hypothetical protein
MHPLIEKIAKKKDKNWIAGATKNEGGLHKSLGIPEDKKIPKKDLKVKPGDSTKVKKQKNLAKTLEKLGIAKEGQPKQGILSKIKGGAKKVGKYGKWGGLGLGVYLTLKALEGAKEAKQEATHRW